MAPKAKVPSHVFGYGLATLPAVLYGIFWFRNHKTDEEMEEKLRQTYASEIENSKAKRENMIKFLEEIKNPNGDQLIEDRLAEVLRGGKDQTKRHYAVDKELYGTEKGVQERAKKAAEEEEQKKKQKQKRNRQKHTKKKQSDDDELTETNLIMLDTKKEEKKEKKEEEMMKNKKHSASVVDVKANEQEAGMDEKDRSGTELADTSELLEPKIVTSIVIMGILGGAVGFFFGGRRS